MAPDLNSVPPSPRPSAVVQSQHSSNSRQPSLSSSRRASQIFPMNPPPLPLASAGGALPASVQTSPFPPLSPVPTASSDGSGQGLPMRHPRPMTAAELYMELEKEQEAVVNRLTRELTALRAHSASVASTTSSTSTSTQPNMLMESSESSTHANSMTGPTHPTVSRRHRSSSTTSTGIPLTAPTPGLQHYYHRPASLGAASSADPAHQASTPSAMSRTTSQSLQNAAINGGPTTPRYEEVLMHRQELDDAKRENERLRRRVRELEMLVRGRRASSVSTSASEVGRARSGSVRRGEVDT